MYHIRPVADSVACYIVSYISFYDVSEGQIDQLEDIETLVERYNV